MAATEQRASSSHYAAIVEQSNDAILTKNRDTVITSWNPAAERMYGWTRDEAVGRPVSILIPPNRSGEEREITRRVFAGELLDHYETERMTKDGRLIMVSLTISPVYGPDGNVAFASVIARDTTQRHRTLTLSASLQALTGDLAKEIDANRAIQIVLSHAVSGLSASAGAVGLLTEDGDEIELVGSAGYSAEGLSGWDRFPLSAEVPMSLAIRSGEPVWTTSSSELVERFPVHGGRDIRFEALAVIPLVVERPFGAIALSFTDEKEFDTEERAFLLASAQQAAYALERARLYESEQTVRERLSFLAEASDILSGSLDLAEALRLLADLSVHRICDWCGIDLVDDQGEIVHVAVAHRDPTRVALANELRARYPVDPDAETGSPNVIRTGEPEMYPEIPDEMLVEAARDDEHLRLMRELGLSSAMVVPLTARGRSLGAITFVSAEQSYGPADLELAHDLARRAAMSIDNSMLYRREHEAAVTLQRSLLPHSLPELAGVEFAVRYEPGAAGLEVGGDWYEVVERPGGTVAVIIGDVAGRGVRAAAVMGRMRTALRAYVLDGHSACDALVRLDALIKESDSPEMSTVFQLDFDPGDGSGQYVRAGHPPALLRLASGEVLELNGRGTPPLGILNDFSCVEHDVDLPPGSLLLLYTDGLIERRGEDVVAMLERLKEVFGRAPANAGECLDWIAEKFGAESVPDDVAMLAMARAPEGA